MASGVGAGWETLLLPSTFPKSPAIPLALHMGGTIIPRIAAWWEKRGRTEEQGERGREREREGGRGQSCDRWLSSVITTVTKQKCAAASGEQRRLGLINAPEHKLLLFPSARSPSRPAKFSHAAAPSECFACWLGCGATE